MALMLPITAASLTTILDPHSTTTIWHPIFTLLKRLTTAAVYLLLFWVEYTYLRNYLILLYEIPAARYLLVPVHWERI